MNRKRVVSAWATVAAALALAVLAWLFCSEPEPVVRSPESPGSDPVMTGVLPYAGGPEGYAGSSECRACHEGPYDSWHRSYHRTMTQALSKESVKADFSGVALDWQGERFRLSETNGVFEVAIESVPAPGTAAAEPIRLRPSLLTGSHHMQVFWLPGGHGNLHIGFPFTWLIEDRRWVPRQDTFIRDPDQLPAIEVWNQVCIRCHVTGGIPKPIKEAEIFASEAVELGVSCEACHGPAQEHVRLRRQEAETGESLEARLDPIVQPAELPADRSAQVCGNCHSIKWFDRSEEWETRGFRFRPGDDLEATTPVIRASKTGEQSWLESVLNRHPKLLEDFFWSDGMMRVTGREYNGLLESACHTQGGLSCVSCHSMHRSDPDDQLARDRHGNQACVACHESIGDDVPAHTRHEPGSSGSLCYNCHMPHTSYGILKAIRSHQIDSPSVTAEKLTGRPNACNLCHLDRSLAWTADRLQQWFGQELPELDQDDRELADVPRMLLTGDAGQRALAAWHLGWDAARETSGSGWQPALLAPALQDRYSAVRYIAGKSLMRFPGYESLAYDYVGPAAEREEAAKTALRRWLARSSSTESFRAAHGFFDGPGQLRQAEVQRLLEEQNQRSVRLRE